MIYLFNDVKELTGTVRNNHILNLLYEREKNGIYSVSAEIPVTYNDQGTIYNYNKKIQKSDFLGHYDREGRFQLHKIAAVDIEIGSIFVKGIHIFFDEAKAGAIIKDRRFINREIIDGARVAFESIGWSVSDFDVSVGKTYNFYNVTPLEARQILVETFGFEFDYWLDFDGKKVTNRHVAVKEKIGEKTSKRYTYGHNVLNIRAEQDYSEIYTAVIGRGKGEEVEETGGYGRRIEYTDVVWSKPSKPLNKPAGTRVLEDPSATQLFGYKENGVVKPRIKVEVFSDIESPTELIQASYEWLMDNNVPKAVFSLKVADGDGLNLGDEVYVIYRDIDLVKSARVEKVTDDLVSGNRDVEFGDTAYFDTDRRLSGLRSDLKRYSGETGDRIYQLKMEFNRRFDEEVSSWVAEFEQALIDAHAQIEADRENMTNLIEGTRTEFTDNLNAEITQTKEYAEQQAQAQAGTVRTDLETVTSGHQELIDGLKDSVLDIDTFLGDKSKTLKQQFDKVRTDFGTLQTDLDGVESDLTATKTDLQKQLDAARADLDGLEVGGRNYLKAEYVDSYLGNSTEVIDGWYVVNSGNYGGIILSTASIEKGFDYVISFEYMTTDNSGHWTISEPRKAVPAKYGTNKSLNLIQDGLVHKHTEKITATSDEDISIALLRSQSEGTVYYKKDSLKIEKGTIATDWTPAPEDTEQKITTLNQQIEFIDGQLSAKLEQTDLLPINNKITEYGNSLTANAQSIESLISKTELHDGDITKWSNQTTANAENITSALSRISNTESGITKAQTDITANADGLSAVVNRVNKTETGIDSLSTSLTAEAGKVGALITKTDGHDTQLTSIEADTKNIKQSVSSITADYVKQSSVSVSADKVLIGSTAINGDALSSVISVSPTAIDLISDKINVTGNLNIKGGVTALAVDAIEGNFASLFAEELSTTTLESIHIGSESILAEHLKVSNVMAEKFMANSVMASSIKTLSLEAVYADVGNLRAEILTANVIRTGHLDVTTTMVEKFYSHSAFIGNATIKAANITDLNSITISANQIRGGTIQALDDSFYLNMMSGLMYFRNGANIRFYNEGLAVQHSLLNYTVGLGFQSHLTSREYPGVWLGGTTSSAVDPNHTTFTGMWAVPEKNDLQFTSRMFRFRAQQGLVNATERQIVLDMSQSSTVNLYPTGVDANSYNLGRPTYKWRSVWTNDLNNFRLVDLPNAQRLLYKDNGIEVNDSGNLIFIHKGSRYNLDYILNRI